jgi:heme/copper-type cytochrome/quinol oxidase subunit 4
MADDDPDIKNYAIYFAFIAILTILAINLVKSQSQSFSIIYLIALLVTLFFFAKIIGMNVPKIPLIEKKESDSGKDTEEY